MIFRRINSKYYLIFIVIFLNLTCNFFEYYPDEDLKNQDYRNNVYSLNNLLTEAYDLFSSPQFAGAYIWVISDLLSGQIETNHQSDSWGEISLKRQDEYNTIAASLWETGYKCINKSNQIIENIDNEHNNDSLSLLKGEALFLRAFCYFELVRLFALPYNSEQSGFNWQPGLPLRTKSSSNMLLAALEYQRAPVEDIYNQIIIDLKDADTLLVIAQNLNGFTTSWSVKSLLSTVYFQQNNFDTAFLYADTVINSKLFTLDNSIINKYCTLWPQKNSESIFDIVNNENYLYSAFYNTTKSIIEFFPSNEIIPELHDTLNDKRWNELIDKQTNNNNIYTKKFSCESANIPLIHLNEIILIRAESAILGSLHNYQIALNDLNQIKTHSYTDFQIIADSTIVIDEIRRERFKELAFEGNCLHEYKRLKISNIDGYAWNDKMLILEIPLSEIKGNPNIELNH